jgi:hypothetical protein
MSLNDWSLVFFAATALYYFTLYVTLFRQPKVSKFVIMTIVWMIHLGVTLVYGIATEQIGFIFVFFTEVMLAIIMFAATGKMLRDANS